MPAITLAAAPEPVAKASAVTEHAVTERQLFEYLAEMQARSGGKASTLANPAALAGEMLQRLQGFADRSAQISGGGEKKVSKVMDKDLGMTSDLTSGEVNPLHGGPAREGLLPAQAGGREAGAVEPVSDGQLEQMVETLLSVMRFSSEAAVVTTGTGNVSRSFQTLMRGQ